MHPAKSFIKMHKAAAEKKEERRKVATIFEAVESSIPWESYTKHKYHHCELLATKERRRRSWRRSAAKVVVNLWLNEREKSYLQRKLS